MVRLLEAIALLALTSFTIAGPTNANQGDRQSDDDVCNSYEDCGSSGLKYWNILHTTLQQSSPRDRSDGAAIFLETYGVTVSDLGFDMANIASELTSHGFDPKLLTNWATTSIDPKTRLDNAQYQPYINDFDTKNGLIIAQSNYREFDRSKTLPWSELIYYTWQIIQSQQNGSPISNLRTVVRKQVCNPGTLDVLRAIYKSQQLTTGAGDNKWYKWTEADQMYSFYGLLGTDNVKGVVWLLNDHAAAIGKKEITEIWTRWGGQSPDIWIEIAPAQDYGQRRRIKRRFTVS
ncbi:MAG: hypothetical protein Q9218_005008 [Villophora microphyllina]